MANIQFIDGAGSVKYLKTNSGAGSNGDPFISAVACETNTSTVIGKVIVDSVSSTNTVYNGVLVLTAASVVYNIANTTQAKNKVVITRPSGSSGNIYVGGSSVTISDGFPVTEGTPLFLNVNTASAIYAISDTPSQELRFLVL